MGRKRVLALVVLLVMLLAVTGCLSGEFADIHVFKVGKADSILIQAEGTNILIDTAEDEDGEKIVSKLAELGVTKIDLLVITHFDKDHVGGADIILGMIEVGEILRPDYTSDSKETLEYRNALGLVGKADTVLTEERVIHFNNGQLTLIPPADIVADTDNDNSIVAVFEYCGSSILLAADAEEHRIDELLENEAIGDCTVIKMPHHGRMKDNLGKLIEKTTPDAAIITASDKNPPEQETLALLDSLGITDIYVTANGDITVRFESNNAYLMQ